MKVNINSVKFKADQGLQEFINGKVGKLSEFYEGVIGTDVTLKIANNEKQNNKVAEIRLVIPGYDLFARKQSKSFEESTDEAIDALRKQLTKHKEKVRGK